jgi:hypothetical protein
MHRNWVAKASVLPSTQRYAGVTIHAALTLEFAVSVCPTSSLTHTMSSSTSWRLKQNDECAKARIRAAVTRK